MTNKMKKILVISALLLIAAAAAVLVMVNPWQSDAPPTSTDPSNTVDTTPTGDPANTDPTDPGTDTTNPTDPGTDPTDPGTDSTDPSTGDQPAGPGTDNTDPTAPGTDSTDPTDPGTDNTEPADPGTDSTEPTAHTHSYTSKVTTAATCTAAGVKTFTCACGDSYTESIKKLNHSYTSKVTTAATCTSTGVKTFTCSCGDSYTETVKKLNHSYSSKVTAPTCTAGGYTTYTCKCGHSYTGNSTNAKGHSYGAWVTITEATETTAGEAKRTCGACGNVETKVIPKGEHIHSYSETVVAPTCKVDGYTLHSCVCGDSYKDTYVEARGTHLCTSTTVQPTCTEDGYIYKECAECDYTSTSTPYNLKATGHSYGSWTTVKAATATETGLQRRTCGECGHVNEQVIPKTDGYVAPYIDPRIEKEYLGNGRYAYTYEQGKSDVWTWCSWDCQLTIRIRADNGLDVTYYKQDGTKVEHSLATPPEDHWITLTIKEDGSYTVGMNGSIA